MPGTGTLEQLGAVHEGLADWVDALLVRRQIPWSDLESGDAFRNSRLGALSSLQDLIQFFVLSDPVHFAECLFRWRDTGDPWRLWDYQKISARYRGWTIHQCGAEVGKSMEIVLLAIWGSICQQGDTLVAAPLDGHLEFLYQEIVFQLRGNPWLSQQVNWDQSRIKPYRQLVFPNGNHLYFRPGGVDGQAFRSLHVQRVLGDEWALTASEQTHGNLMSRAKPGAVVRLYSTPTDCRETPYYRLCVSTPVVDPLVGPPAGAAQNQFARFLWPKSLMKGKFWTPDREQQFIRDYGGRESNEYQRNVLGLWGDPSQTVFRWASVVQCLTYIPEYRHLRLSWSAGEGLVYVDASQLNSGYRFGVRSGDDGGDALQPPMSTPFRDTLQAENLDIPSLLRAQIGFMPGHVVIGADLGSINDPTEIIIGRLEGETVRWVRRISLVQWDYHRQASLLRDLYQQIDPDHGMGLDATGAGINVQQLLEEDGRLFNAVGYVLNAKTEDTDPETGRPSQAADGKPRSIRYRDLGMRLLEVGIQRGQFALPWDEDLMSELQNLQAKTTANGERKYAGRDHITHAMLVACLRVRDMTAGSALPPPVIHVPAGSRKRFSATGW